MRSDEKSPTNAPFNCWANNKKYVQAILRFLIEKYFNIRMKMNVFSQLGFSIAISTTMQNCSECINWKFLETNTQVLIWIFALTKYHMEGHLGSLSRVVNDLRGFSRVKSRFWRDFALCCFDHNTRSSTSSRLWWWSDGAIDLFAIDLCSKW